MMNYITIVGSRHYFGIEVFKIGQKLVLEKDYQNAHDDEAIRVLSETGAIYGYVANSIHTVARGSKSAGRIYDVFQNDCQCEVLFMIDEYVIAKLL